MRALFLCLACLSLPVAAADFYSLQVTREGDIYRVAGDVHLAAPPADVYQVLTDYDHLTAISRTIVKSQLRRRLDDGSVLVYSDSRACVLLFCRHIEQVQHITELAPYDISSLLVPDQQDPKQDSLKQSTAHWHLEAEGEGTRMRWDMMLEPAFWVPPLIGPSLVERSLREEGRRSALGVEQAARKRAKLPPLTDKDQDATHPSPAPAAASG